MKFKFKALAAACTLAFAGQSFAAVAPTDVPAVTLYMSGSSALQNATSMVAEYLFDTTAGVIELWDSTDGTAANTKGSSYRAYLGYIKNVANLPDGTPIPTTIRGKEVLVHYRAAGGSVYGVTPVALANEGNPLGTIAFLTPASCGSSPVKTNPLTGIAVYACTGTANHATEAGISDVDPAMLNAPINQASAAGVPAFPSASDPTKPWILNSTELASLTPTAVVDQVFGIIVNGTSVQGSLHPATPGMLTLSSAQVAGLMGGTISDWNLIDPTHVSAGTSTLVICRRQPGSGTQASINSQIFGAPCSSGAATPLTYTADAGLALGSTTPVGLGNVVVVEDNASGDLAGCMTYVNSNTNLTKAIDTTTGKIVAAGSPKSVVLDASANTYYAIGLMGLDHAVGTDIYQNTMLNANVASLANGSMGYNLMVESTFNQPSNLSGAKLDLFTAYTAEAGSPTMLGSVPVPGVLALGENGWTPSAAVLAGGAFEPSNPVARVGNFANNCSPMEQLQ